MALRSRVKHSTTEPLRSLFPVKMIAKLESIPKQRPTQNPHKQWEVHKTINQQQQQNHRFRTEAA